jgi:molybdate transport system ATP-binding protein
VSLEVDVLARRDGFELRVEIEAEPGETVALLGPNGSGKSTLTRVLAGLLLPREGRVVLDGRTLDDAVRGTHVPAEERPIGVVFQELLLFPHLSALENAAFPLRARGEGRAAAEDRARALLRRLGVDERADARPSALSGGEAQRVALARALVPQPDLLLLDEPTSALDVRARGRIRALIGETLARFAGIRLLVTHDPVEAMTLGDRLVVVEEGRVSQTGTPGELRDAPRTSYIAELVGLNMFAGLLEPLEEGAGRIRTPEGDLIVAWPAGVSVGPVEAVTALLRPADVSLHAGKPEGSARNVFRGKVTAISLEGERARVRIDARPPLVAEVTLGSVERLGLTPGGEVWASFKAVEVNVLVV